MMRRGKVEIRSDLVRDDREGGKIAPRRSILKLVSSTAGG